MYFPSPAGTHTSSPPVSQSHFVLKTLDSRLCKSNSYSYLPLFHEIISCANIVSQVHIRGIRFQISVSSAAVPMPLTLLLENSWNHLQLIIKQSKTPEFYFYCYLCVYECDCEGIFKVWVGILRGQKRASGPLKLTLETIVNFIAWVLGSKFQCSARAVCEYLFNPNGILLTCLFSQMKDKFLKTDKSFMLICLGIFCLKIF